MRRATIVLLVALLAATTSGAIAAESEPSAMELLERAKRGESVTETDSTSAQSPMWSIGVGANRLSPLFEFDSYFGAARRFGAYVGLGVKLGSVGAIETSLVTNHFGASFRPDRYWRLGLGAEKHQASATLDAYGQRFSAVVDEWGPHGWFELGLERGFALRTQIGTEGMGITAHWRF